MLDRSSLAVDYIWAGRWDDALEQLDAAFAMPDRLAYMETAIRGPKLQIEASRGQAPGDVLAQMQSLVDQGTELGDLQTIVPTHAAAAWVHLMAGDEDTAFDHARSVVEVSGATRYLIDAFGMTIWLFRRAGEISRIGELLGDLRRFDMPRPRALVAVVDALLAEDSDPSAALEGVSAAADDLAGLGLAVEATFALSEAARIADALGDSDRAGALRAQALDSMADTRADRLFEVLGLAWSVAGRLVIGRGRRRVL